MIHRRRQWHPTPVLLPRKSHGRRSLVGCSPRGRWGSDTTDRLHFHFHALEKEMATHSSVLAWKSPGTGEPGGLPSMGCTESDTTEATSQQQQQHYDTSTWLWVNSRSWWWTGRPGVLWFMESQRVGHDWAPELNWTELIMIQNPGGKKAMFYTKE